MPLLAFNLLQEQVVYCFTYLLYSFICYQNLFTEIVKGDGNKKRIDHGAIFVEAAAATECATSLA